MKENPSVGDLVKGKREHWRCRTSVTSIQLAKFLLEARTFRCARNQKESHCSFYTKYISLFICMRFE